ncbi:MAG TPA: hypothetical protein PK788_13520 [Gemmatimonadaceae bacterium]|nr:hypothetical protein [Gemmatimonadaceae bacterium]HRQ77923.1 hypothetical protein [Gemmatimonadaceae bacterium]
MSLRPPLRGLRAGCLWALGAVGVLAPALPAQESGASLAVGAAQVRFADEAAFTSMTITPALTLRGMPGVLTLNATFAQVGTAGWSQQGVATGSLYSPLTRGRVMFEATGSAGGSRFPGGYETGQALLGLRAHRLGDKLSAWGGAFAGGLNDGASWRRVEQAELGIAGTGRYHRGSLVASPAIVSDTLRFMDVLAAYGTARGAWDVTLSLGARAGTLPLLVGGDQRVWGGAQLALWLAPRRAMLIGIGTYPVDVTQGFPAGRYVSLGFRIGTRRSLAAQVQSEAWASREVASASGVQAFDLSRGDDGTIAISVRADAAQRVELSGDLTRWQTVALVRGSDGRWWGRFPAPLVEVVELALRIDGGDWLVPPGTEMVRDEFGGLAGRVVLPPRR